MFPVYCTQCRAHVPVAISNAGHGLCPACAQAAAPVTQPLPGPRTVQLLPSVSPEPTQPVPVVGFDEWTIRVVCFLSKFGALLVAAAGATLGCLMIQHGLTERAGTFIIYGALVLTGTPVLAVPFLWFSTVIMLLAKIECNTRREP